MIPIGNDGCQVDVKFVLGVERVGEFYHVCYFQKVNFWIIAYYRDELAAILWLGLHVV